MSDEEHTEDELKQISDSYVHMDGEIGFVTVRLFNQGGKYSLSTMAYMVKQLTDEERKRLVRVWNQTDASLRATRPQQAHKEEDE